jgi:hypothetical protein
MKAYRSMEENVHAFSDSGKCPAYCFVCLYPQEYKLGKGLRPEVDVMEKRKISNITADD